MSFAGTFRITAPARAVTEGLGAALSGVSRADSGVAPEASISEATAFFKVPAWESVQADTQALEHGSDPADLPRLGATDSASGNGSGNGASLGVGRSGARLARIGSVLGAIFPALSGAFRGGAFPARSAREALEGSALAGSSPLTSTTV